MARGDTYFLNIPGGIGPHSCVILKETQEWVIAIYGQTHGHAGAHRIAPPDACVSEFGGHVVYETHFDRMNVAFIPLARLPQTRLGHIDDNDLPGFLRAAREGLADWGKVVAVLDQQAQQCQCQGGCQKHPPQCPAIYDATQPHTVMDWRMTVKNQVFCRVCFES